jgi:hypothetical protein
MKVSITKTCLGPAVRDAFAEHAESRVLQAAVSIPDGREPARTRV